jgi:transcriptional regulator with XRE-family HTH domain
MIDAEWIAGRIRELREGRGWTREDLAKAAGVSVRAIVQWERSEREPSWSNVLALAQALGVDCTAFTQESTTPPEPRARGRPRKPDAVTKSDADAIEQIDTVPTPATGNAVEPRAQVDEPVERPQEKTGEPMEPAAEQEKKPKRKSTRKKKEG